MSEKIGILGGTFNPIHRSHIYLAEEAFSALGLNRLLLIPTFIPPHKQPVGLASADNRVAMCELAAEGKDGWSVCDYEVKKQGVSYTVDTLGYLHGLYPAAQFHLIMGADMFLTLDSWREPEKIFRLADISAAARNEGEIEKIIAFRPSLERMGAVCHLLEIPPKAISSTEIRELIGNGKDPSRYLTAEVWAYIKKHKLYGATGVDSL